MEQNRQPRNRPHLYWNLINNRNVTADQRGNYGLQENSEEHIYDFAAQNFFNKKQRWLTCRRKDWYIWSEGKLLSRVQLFATSWTVANQAPPSMGFSRQEYWSGLPFLFPGDLNLGPRHCMQTLYRLSHYSSVWVKSFTCVWLFAIPWTVAYQASQSMGFSRQEYWSGLPFPSPGDLPDPEIEPGSPAL